MSHRLPWSTRFLACLLFLSLQAQASNFSDITAWTTLNPAAPDNYAHPALPAFFDARVLAGRNTPPTDPVSDKGASLGRVLFWDRRLSVNNAVACASCHLQGVGFGATSRFSTGFSGQQGTFHAMRLGNIAFYRSGQMFWNKRAASVEDQALQPIENAIEMGYDPANGGINALIVKMQALPYYPQLMNWVYGDPAITPTRIAAALSQFERAMISTGSRFDQGYAKTWNPALPDQGLSLDLPNFTAQENRGRRLFLLPPQQGGLGCNGCHQAPTFALDPKSLSNGLDAGNAVVFKAPSLKGIQDGMPMMHDGRFTTLAQVVNHYSLGVQAGPALDHRLQGPDGRPRIPNFPPADAAALVAFLKTLQDPVLAADRRFSNPLRK